MCGIVGYVGSQETAPFLIQGLKRLEYRGYDSAGIAVLNSSDIKILRKKGNLSFLEAAINYSLYKGNVGVGHTRWATHGAPSETNAHPHLDCQQEIAVAHNGIIENFQELKEELQKRGHLFKSETDTEVIAHLIEEAKGNSLLAKVQKAVLKLKGSYALAVISKREPNCLIGVRKDSPLVVGLGKSGFFIASDIPALLDHTRKVLILEDNEVVRLTNSGYDVYNLDGQSVAKKVTKISWDVAAAEKQGYEDFMLKEIFEQPAAVKETLRGRLLANGQVDLPEVKLSQKTWQKVKKVIITACGSSLHAGLIARFPLEQWLQLPVEIDCSSEFRYRSPLINYQTLLIAITQSGETADTLASLRLAKAQGATTLAITNVVGSTAAREANGVIYTHAGPEIGVAATKTLTAQITALLLLAKFIGQKKLLASKEAQFQLSKLAQVPDLIATVLKQAEAVKEVALKHAACNSFLYLGRGVQYPVALEGALKLKEISYIHAEGYPAGEMKHGPIALITPETPVLALAVKDRWYQKMLSNIQEVKARGGRLIVIATEGDERIKSITNNVIYVPPVEEFLAPLLTVIPLQLIAYYIAKERGCNVDQPRNLAKSVTVE